MLARTRKRPIEKMDAARFLGPPDKIMEVRRFAVSLGLSDLEDTIDYRDAFPEFSGKEPQIAVKAYRMREGLTQEELAKLAEIPRRHISDMENGRRPIGKENARKLAKVLNVDYRMFL
ncbi:XRE family transcriptional regulator [Oryzomonas rubra]|uniref:XRE family transcriptional regulator n=2 Tax=Oryzomonas rubra TaxID=2509454 RepID=A0A5A9XQ59_9BACT|nr:XRE family transcriptional regulator [Oryzomonas rubra]